MRNTSGLIPVEYKIVVLLDEVQKKTEGGIYLPDNTHEREQMAQVKGTLIAVGGMAFNEGYEGEWKGTIPKPGDRVLVSKYPGATFEGDDGKEYQCCQDKDILGIWQKEKKKDV